MKGTVIIGRLQTDKVKDVITHAPDLSQKRIRFAVSPEPMELGLWED
jgi:hypothetical protein